MPDIREDILARLVVVCAGVTGIVMAGRNLTDVPLMARPAVVVTGGGEQLLSQPRPAARFSQVQLMELAPQITLLVRADTGNEAGTLMSLYRSRLINAILSDATLRTLVTTNGAIRYEGCSEPDPTPESKEPRLELQIAFTYPLRLSDFAAYGEKFMATPDLDNLSLFKGIIKWMAASESSYRDLGECLSFTTSMEAETLVYNSRRHSSRIPVKTLILGKTLNVGITMSEMDAANLEIWSMGEAGGSPGVIEIGTAAEVRGALRYIGTNEVGRTFQVDLFDVLLTPDGDLEWLADTDWSEMQITGSANADTATGSFGQIREITAGIEVPAGSPPV